MSFTHDRIICSLLCVCLSPPLFSSFLLGVLYTNSIHSLWALEFHWNMAHGCLDIGHINKYTSGISYILMEITTYSYQADGTQRYKRFTLSCYELCSGKTYGYSNEYQSVDIKVLLHQSIQCIKNNYNILAQAPDTQYVGYVSMTMSRTKITYNQFYHC